jgi:hypothetical protein
VEIAGIAVIARHRRNPKPKTPSRRLTQKERRSRKSGHRNEGANRQGPGAKSRAKSQHPRLSHERMAKGIRAVVTF